MRDKLPTFPVVVQGGNVYVTLPSGSTAASLTRETPHMCPASASDGRHFVIVGAGPAGLAAAETLRCEGFGGRITLLNRETGVPYDRTLLSKNMEVSTEDDDGAAMNLRSPQWLASKGITIQEGVTVTALDTGNRTLALAGGGTLGPYDALLCATGGPARTFRADAGEPGPPPIPGAELPGIFPLRTAHHGAALAAAAATAIAAGAPILIQGSSFIGMEAAAYFVASLGATDVTVVGMERCPFERTLGPRVGEFMQGLHEARGVKFIMGATVTAFEGGGDGKGGKAKGGGTTGGRVSGAHLKYLGPTPPPGAPTFIPAACVVVGAGIIPAVEYLKGAAGVALVAAMPGGVEVDETLATGAPGVWAAGDIANIPLRYGLSANRWRIEHWNVAIDQGRVAAKNMLRWSNAGGGAGGGAGAGALEPYHCVPFFWTLMYGKYLRCAGFCKAPDSVVLQGKVDKREPSESRFLVWYIVGERVEAVASFNEPVGAAGSWSAAALELIKLDRLPRAAALKDSETPFDLCGLLEKVVAERG